MAARNSAAPALIRSSLLATVFIMRIASSALHGIPGALQKVHGLKKRKPDHVGKRTVDLPHECLRPSLNGVASGFAQSFAARNVGVYCFWCQPGEADARHHGPGEN